MKKILGITGLMCSGKTTFANNISKVVSSFVYDCDINGKKILNEKKGEIGDIFGQDIFFPNGELNYKLLANKCFNKKDNIQKLENIVWTQMERDIRESIEYWQNREEELYILDSPLLFQAGFNKYCDVVVILKQSREVLLERYKKRSGRYANIDDFNLRLNRQIEYFDKEFVKPSNVYIDTNLYGIVLFKGGRDDFITLLSSFLKG